MARCCTPLADPTVHPAGFYRGLRLVAVDGSTFELAGDPVIEQEFGRPGGRQGQAGYPQARCVVLAECASHAILGANLGPYGSGEWALCQPLLAHLRAGMLCLADRGFNGFEHWEQARATGAQLLWRCGATRKLPLEQMLDDGSYLSTIGPGGVSVEEARSRAIKVGTDALHRALAAAPGSRATPDPARGLVRRRARPMGPPATAPVRGLPLHGSPDVEPGGSGRCLTCPSRCVPAARSIAGHRAWSSAATTATRLSLGAHRDACPSIPRRRPRDLCRPHRLVAPGCAELGRRAIRAMSRYLLNGSPAATPISRCYAAAWRSRNSAAWSFSACEFKTAISLLCGLTPKLSRGLDDAKRRQGRRLECLVRAHLHSFSFTNSTWSTTYCCINPDAAAIWIM